VNEDGSVRVSDNGRGIPVDNVAKVGKPAVEVVLTVLHAGGKFTESAYKVSGGLHGVGVSVVNFLSEWLQVDVHRNNLIYRQRFTRGIPDGELTVVGTSDHTGTIITFKPDHQIFETLEFSAETLMYRLRELAFLNAGVKITLKDHRTGFSEVFQYHGGIKSFVEHLNK